jgi:hypothetical protein
MPSFTVAQAARLAGRSEATLTRDIEGGRLRAERLEDGSYRIDGAELRRAFGALWSAEAAEGSDPVPQAELAASASKYRNYASRCVQLTRQAAGEDRAVYMELAETWLRLAEHAEALGRGPAPVHLPDAQGKSVTHHAPDRH